MSAVVEGGVEGGVGSVASRAGAARTLPKPRRKSVKDRVKRHWQLYLLLVLPVAYFVIFQYIPMANNVIAFKDYNVVQGI